eukprot:scaffold278378_cov35-Tisochrysis_lutea.AAC.4
MGNLVADVALLRAPDGVSVELVRKARVLPQQMEPDWTLEEARAEEEAAAAAASKVREEATSKLHAQPSDRECVRASGAAFTGGEEAEGAPLRAPITLDAALQEMALPCLDPVAQGITTTDDSRHENRHTAIVWLSRAFLLSLVACVRLNIQYSSSQTMY